MQRKPKQKPWTQMTTAELAEATKEFDKPLPPDAFRPLSKEKRARFERARRMPSRSIFVHVTSGRMKRVNVELDEELLRRSREYAQKHDLSLSEFISRSVQGTLIAVTHV